MAKQIEAPSLATSKQAHALVLQCVASINCATAIGTDIKDASILVTTPKGWKAPPRFPRGSIVQWHEDGSRTRYLPAVNTLAWLVAHGAARVLGANGKANDLP